MMLTGFEMPNRPTGEVTPEEWQRWDALPGRVAKVRPYSLTRATLDYLAASKVEAVILRPTADGDIDVEARVNDLQPAIVQLMQWDIPIVVIPDNEPQLGNKPYQDGYWEKVSQVIAHPAMVNLWGEKVKIASPPMAVMQNEEAWYDAGRDVLPAFDFISVHLYGQLNADFVHRSLALAHQFGPPLIADEVGDSHPTANQDLKAVSVSSYLRIAADSGVQLATLFNMGGSDEWRTFWFDPDVIRRCLSPIVEMVRQ